MAIPASVIPAGNSYSVNVAGPSAAADLPASQLLTVTAAVAGALLKPYNVDVRQHLTGDDAASRKRRDFLSPAGAKASAFSPAPSPGLPGEGFWKTTLAVVETTGSHDFWWPPREDKKVEWEPLLVALCDARGGTPDNAGAGFSEIPAAQIQGPDLWVVAAARDAAAVAQAWIARGAGAVAVISPNGVAWASRSATFGNAQGSRPFTQPVDPNAFTAFTFGCFAGGVVAGLIEEVLGENAFDKGIVRVERSELEARPLHVGKAAGQGSAAARASVEETPERLLHKGGDLVGRVRAHLLADLLAEPGGAPKPWGSKGR